MTNKKKSLAKIDKEIRKALDSYSDEYSPLDTANYIESYVKGIDKSVINHKTIKMIESTLEKFKAAFWGDKLHTPDLLISLISELANNIKGRDVLIPFEKDGSITKLFATKLNAGHITTILTIDSLTKKLNKLYGSSNKVSFGASYSKSVNKQWYDLVISDMPWGMHRDSKTIVRKTKKIKITDSVNHLMMINSISRMKTDGFGIFTTSNDFFKKSNSKSVFSNFHNLDLYLNGVFKIPPNIYKNTSLSINVVYISHKKTDKVFISKVNEDNLQEVVRNFYKQKIGKIPELGMYVNNGDFSTPEYAFLEQDIRKQSRRLGADLHHIQDIVTEIVLPNRKEKSGGFEDHRYGIYLPSIGNSPAVTTLSQFQIKPQNYIQIIFRKDANVNLGFLAHYMSSEIGKKLRQLWSGGLYIPKISKTSIENSFITLPQTNIQTQILQASQDLDDIRTTVDQAAENLWDNNRSLNEINEYISRYKHKGDIENWLETIPFPLASIIWKYKANLNARDKVESLLCLFESTAELLATIYLSAAIHNDTWLKAIVDKDTKFDKAHFGLWTVIGERAAKQIRRLRSKGDEQSLEELYAMYKTKSDGFYNMLSSKQLFVTLNQARIIRNDIAHGGITNEQTYEYHLSELSRLLNQAKKIVGSSFIKSQLIRPNSSRYRDGVYSYKAHLLNGSRSPFREVNIKTSTPLDEEKLYLNHSDTTTPFELLPLFILRPSPKSEINTIYFYNKTVGNKLQYISYHLSSENKQLIDDPQIIQTLEKLIKRVL